jgi:SAM-dependent methyltransferase
MTNRAEQLVTIANPEQAESWNGSEGRRWSEHAESHERANRRHTRRLFAGAAVSAGDAVVDIGCGTGQTTREAARLATRGSASGVDLSASMLEHAREQSRAEGLTNIAFVQADAQVHRFDAQASDVAISSFGVMFFSDPIAAFTNVGRALVPGGRVALVVWRELARNEWITELRSAMAVGRELPEPPPGAPSPFSLADPDRVHTILRAAGFDDIDVESVDEPLDFGATPDDAYAFLQSLGVVEGLTHGLDETQRAEASTGLRSTIDAHAAADGVLFGASAWLVTARHP